MINKRDYKKEREGLENVNKFGTKMKIKEYINKRQVVVEFEDGSTRVSEYKHFVEGSMISRYDKTCHGVGFLGEGEYKSTEDGKDTIYAKYWREMISRCYSEKFKSKHLSYENCSVCEEWHNFQNFAKWFDENYYECNGEQMCLDKDIVSKTIKFIRLIRVYLYHKELISYL